VIVAQSNDPRSGKGEGDAYLDRPMGELKILGLGPRTHFLTVTSEVILE
jgi:hypothetical protein